MIESTILDVFAVINGDESVLQKKITHLDLSNNQLTVIPSLVYRMRSLILLNLNDNKLTKISDELSKLQSLKFLHLSNNKLQKLPDTIGDMESLVRIDVDNNCLTSLPESIQKLKKLKYFDEMDNNFQSVPKHIVDFFYEHCSGTFEDFYSVEQKSEKNKLNKNLNCTSFVGRKISISVFND